MSNSNLNLSHLTEEEIASLITDLPRRLKQEDVYKDYDPEARAYFEMLDSVGSSLRVVYCECDFRIETLRRINTDLIICTNGVAIHNVKHLLSDAAYEEFLRNKYPLAKAYLYEKPSWLERLLQKLR